MIVVVAGVAASGKLTVGTLMADRLGWPFTDADSLHPAANVAKMHAGLALNDEDRRPWMAAVTERIDGYLEAGQSAVLTCSLLKRSYRDQLTAGLRCGSYSSRSAAMSWPPGCAPGTATSFRPRCWRASWPT